jgi:xanthine/CO dehydrogenase XdhC/CoxF family maturation factor
MQNIDDDHAALFAACESGVSLCTIVGIEGSFSRRLGAQLAIFPDGRLVGSLADGCLEKQIAADVTRCGEPVIARYGRGSRLIDFRLPCGGGLDILLDPSPDRSACRETAGKLEARESCSLKLASNDLLTVREYLPQLRLRVYGGGPKLKLSRHYLWQAASHSRPTVQMILHLVANPNSPLLTAGQRYCCCFTITNGKTRSCDMLSLERVSISEPREAPTPGRSASRA